ncbi:MAG: 6-hydroxycyclohex-1-ene-1-carbonyl-CoA dehydrogenase, partial [Deltaproteobacteria bacterium]
VRSGLREGDLAIFVGVGGVGSFGVQLAAALGAYVVALDVSPLKLDRIAHFGARFTIDVRDLAHRSVKKQIIAHAKGEGLPTTRWKIFETSGTTAGQELAFSLLGPGAYLGVVGYTRSDVCIPLSRLMAFDATARGNWGCLPRYYPDVLALVLSGKVKIAPFVERHPMSQINEIFPKLHEQLITKRPVLIPDFA